MVGGVFRLVVAFIAGRYSPTRVLMLASAVAAGHGVLSDLVAA